jgi:ABC-type transporter Mla MlaB component
MTRSKVCNPKSKIQNLKSKIQNLALAHVQLLERYRLQAEGRWDRLPNDGYIHRHLTWHFVQTGMEDEIHALMAMSDEQGRNAWFEACDRIGQPAIFVQDAKRGWEVADQQYEEDRTRAIVLQCRYALITATLHSLVGNFPAALMSAAVEYGYWTPEQAWSYVEQIQDENRCSQAIVALAPHLSSSLVQTAIERTNAIQNSYCQRDAISGLLSGLPEHLKPLSLTKDSRGQVKSSYFVVKKLHFLSLEEASRAIHTAKDMENRGSRTNALYQIAHQIPRELLGEALEVASLIQDEESFGKAVLKLAQHSPDFFSEVIEILQSISPEYHRFQVLLEIAKDPISDLLPQVLELVIDIRNADRRAQIFLEATRQGGNYADKVLNAARAIQNEVNRASVLTSLAELDSAYFTEALNAAQAVQNEVSRASVLTSLAKLDSANFTQLLDAARAIQDETNRASVLTSLAELDSANFTQLLDAARAIQDETNRAWVLTSLAKLDSAYFTEALNAAQAIQDETNRVSVLTSLAKLDSANFTQLLDAARAVQNEKYRAWVLINLTELDSANFAQLLDAAWAIQNEYYRASVLISLARFDSADFTQLLNAARAIQNEYYRAWILISLAELDSAYFIEALEAARRASALSSLAQLDFAYFIIKSLSTGQKLANR